MLKHPAANQSLPRLKNLTDWAMVGGCGMAEHAYGHGHTSLRGEGSPLGQERADLPVEYRRLLALMEFEGHVDVIRGRLRRFPDRLIEEWLKELEELKLIEPAQSRGQAGGHHLHRQPRAAAAAARPTRTASASPGPR